MNKFACSLIACLVVSSAHAEETSFDVNLGAGALICDYAESVITSLERGIPMPDCGIFRTSTGAPVTVTIIGEYEGKSLARFDFHNPTPWGNQVQYGWWAGTIPGRYDI